MHPSRFVTRCFIYNGVLLLVTQPLIYRSDLSLAVVGNAVTALCLLFVGVFRLYSEQEEKRPAEYGSFASGMVLSSLLATTLFLAGLSMLRW
ncbi:hypothetical protein EL22_03370 [Halostagnicola sp. A56]|uniref:hypothetical protein n=1 Tax=Halostagnicola sp. A56 TaxID=1495067 RepID=UPI00049F8FD6|nr:hypothetical protein [Halostagnicola sp. A56]KDE58678.1 hypothetical protein EL22_03370 [Halostagnicola sp. A56]